VSVFIWFSFHLSVCLCVYISMFISVCQCVVGLGPLLLTLWTGIKSCYGFPWSVLQ